MIIFTPNTVIRSTEINANFDEHETRLDNLESVLLFNGTAARSITISEAYTNFEALRIVYLWVDHYGTKIVDTSTSVHNFPVVRQGLIGGSYRVQVGASSISLSGTTVAGSTTGGTYTINLLSTSAVSFLDSVGELKIVRVTGIGRI